MYKNKTMNYFALMFYGKRNGGPWRITIAGLFLYRRCANDYEYFLLKSAKNRDKYWTSPKSAHRMRIKIILFLNNYISIIYTVLICWIFNVWERLVKSLWCIKFYPSAFNIVFIVREQNLFNDTRIWYTSSWLEYYNYTLKV